MGVQISAECVWNVNLSVIQIIVIFQRVQSANEKRVLFVQFRKFYDWQSTANYSSYYLNSFCWGHGEWHQNSCFSHLTNCHSANTVHLLPHKEPSRSRYTQHCWCMLPDTVRQSMRSGHVDRRDSVCSLLWSIAMLNTNSNSRPTESSSNITVGSWSKYVT